MQIYSVTTRHNEFRLDADERPKRMYEYWVTGRGQFPFDMLRYDSAWPSDSEAASEMMLDQFNHQPSAIRSIKLRSYTEPTIARWQSFLWSVGAEKTQIVETPLARGGSITSGSRGTDDDKPKWREKMKTAEQYRAEQALQAKKDLVELERVVKKVPVPEGFETEWRENPHETKCFVIKRADDVEFIFRPGGSGTTSFKVGDGWRTFDRTGVEDSFYWKAWDFEQHLKIDFKALFAEHLERIEKNRNYHKTAIKIPDIGFTIAPERLDTLKAELNKRGYISFHPSGFGTGYNILKQAPRRHYGVKRGSADLEKFFGVAPLWIESVDCD